MDLAPRSEIMYDDGTTFLLSTRRHYRNNDLEKRAFLTMLLLINIHRIKAYEILHISDIYARDAKRHYNR